MKKRLNLFMGRIFIILALLGLGAPPAFAHWQFCFPRKKCQQEREQKQKQQAHLKAIYNAINKVNPDMAHGMRRFYNLGRAEFWLTDHPEVLARIFHAKKKSSAPKSSGSVKS